MRGRRRIPWAARQRKAQFPVGQEQLLQTELPQGAFRKPLRRKQELPAQAQVSLDACMGAGILDARPKVLHG